MYVSFVITGRNDGYGRNFIERLVTSTTVLTNLIKKYNLDAEVVVVDYNPVPLTDPLSNFIPPGVRTITVQHNTHRMLENPQGIQVYEFVGKNAAIRRSDAEFICCTNADIIFSEGLIEELAKKQLEQGYFYRCNRRDLEEGFVATPSTTFQELIARTSVIHEQEERWEIHCMAEWIQSSLDAIYTREERRNAITKFFGKVLPER